MKHLFYGVAIVAALAIASPALAQGPKASGGGGASAYGSHKPMKKMKKMAPMQRHKRVHHRMTRHGKKMRMSKGDAMTEQLNREELARIQGAMPAHPKHPGPPPNAGAGQGGPRASGH